jgi:hypothetical protein
MQATAAFVVSVEHAAGRRRRGDATALRRTFVHYVLYLYECDETSSTGGTAELMSYEDEVTIR